MLVRLAAVRHSLGLLGGFPHPLVGFLGRHAVVRSQPLGTLLERLELLGLSFFPLAIAFVVVLHPTEV